jgi:putative glutamine amidotransferase
MSAPLIAVSSRPRKAGEVKAWADTGSAVMQETYLQSLWRAGAMESIVAPRETSVDDMRAYLSRVDGLVLVGGGDIDPARYGQLRHDEVYSVEPACDSLEASLILAALELGVPTLAICRGLQMLNVALGGTLVQHISGQPGYQNHGDPREGFALHRVDVDPGSLLSKSVGGATSIDDCWSFHHQVIDQLADGLVVTARSADGTIEAVERSDAATQGWMVAVQWHPERTSHSDAQQQALFNELVAQASMARSNP